MNIRQEVALNLLQIKAIKLSPQNPFTWASGIRSPIYCDNRITLSHPDIRTNIKRHLATISAEFPAFGAVAGVATAGIAHGALLADHLNLPFAYVRSEAKAHGRQNKIEGELPTDKGILVVEDLISTGGSSIQAARVLQDAGYTVVGVVAIFNYEFELAEKQFAEAGLSYRTLSSYSELLAQAESSGYINEKEAQILKEWNRSPAEWYAKHFD